MKKLVLAGLFLVLVSAIAFAAKNNQCKTIKDGLVDSKGNPLSTGYDQWGYNYQAHMFNGFYENYLRPTIPFTSSNDRLMMKWNDAWLSNKDCDSNGKLDRHYGYDSYVGSGAWLTNHQRGTYMPGGGDVGPCEYNYFVKIIAVPEEAVQFGGVWYLEDGEDVEEIGPSIWGEFAIIQEMYKDSCEGDSRYKTPLGPGLGKW